MMLLVGILALGLLFSVCSPPVQRFFEPKPPTSSRPTSKRAWAPKKSGKTSPTVSNGQFWSELEKRLKRDPMAVAMIPRNEGALPIGTWNRLWIPAETFSAPWAAKAEDYRRPDGRGLRAARRASEAGAKGI